MSATIEIREREDCLMWWRKKHRAMSDWAAPALAEYKKSCGALEAFENKELRTPEDWEAYSRAKSGWKAAAKRLSRVVHGDRPAMEFV